ncbi:expansin family protein [Hysterangium stoloniferum]|nr:expansin family protein [Hysterangium stoloniferum]
MYFATVLIASLIVSASALATPHASSFDRRGRRAALAKSRGAWDIRDSDLSDLVIGKKSIVERYEGQRSESRALSPVGPAGNATLGTSTSDAAEPTAIVDPDSVVASDEGGARPFGNFYAGVNTGQGTFYATGLGACGIVNADTEYIAAVSKLLYDVVPGYFGTNPNNNPICGKKVKATYQGKSVTVVITDRCEACRPTDLDFSPSAFNTLADPAIGRLSGVSWTFV